MDSHVSKGKKTITIKTNEGHGRLDNEMESEEISNHPLCRFKYPQYPMSKTTFIPGTAESLDEKEIEIEGGTWKK